MSNIRAVATQNANESNYDASRFNALKHGVLSKFTVLPWEDRDEYDLLLTSVAVEFSPVGTTEEHLVEELAGIFWRKRRLRLAEAATFRRGLKSTIDGSIIHDQGPSAEVALATLRRPHRGDSAAQADIIFRDSKELAVEARLFRAVLDRLQKAVTILQDGNEDSYHRALGALHPQLRNWWQEGVEDCAEDVVDQGAHEPESQYTAVAESLAIWIKEVAQPHFERRLVAINNRDAIKEQAFGDSFDPHRMESLARYETHLDRKLERTLAMLVKLQELRRHREIDDLATGESQ